MCVYNEPVDGASGRLAGTSDCSAAQFSAAVADQNICNQSCGNKHMDMLNLLLGWSRPSWQLVKVSSASLVGIDRDGTSQLVVASQT